MQKNTTTPFLNLSELTVEEKREIFLRRSGWTLVYLAECLGITTPTLSRTLRKKTMPTSQHEILIKLGMPAELLPEPLDVKPGPKPKKPIFPSLNAAQAEV